MIERLVRLAALALGALTLASTGAAAQEPATWTGVDRIVVIGDLHGDSAKFEAILAQAGLVDARGDWAGGAAHLVQVGDIPDRGDETRAIMDHLMRLERQAERAGGRVHALIGNHEAMNIAGDLEYATAGEFAAFADRGSRRSRDRYYRQVTDYLRANPPAAGPVVIDDAFRAQWEREHPLGWVEHRIAWAANGEYGRWVASHDTMIRINDILFVHGGVGPAFASLDRAAVNEGVRTALRGSQQEIAASTILWSEESPLWYRGFAHHDEAAEAPHLEAVLARHGVSRIVVGHTPVAAAILPRFGGRVILTDVWEPDGVEDPRSFLIIEGDRLAVVHRGREIPLEPQTSAGALDYLRTAAALDPAPSPLISVIEELSAPALP